METSAPIGSNSRASALHRALVDKLKSAGCVKTPRIEAAFRSVPRHLFLPSLPLEEVYRDEAIATKLLDGIAISSSSQPAMMAIMLEQLGLEPGQRVLEIGAGTGYNAALMAHIVGDGGQVVTIDIDEDIAESASEHLRAAGFERVKVVWGDGGLGCPSSAPYDRIILTVGTWDIAPAWLEQLRSGGRIVLPLSIRGPQLSVAFEHKNGHLESVSVADCGFMRLRGAFAGPDGLVQLGSYPGLSVTVDNRSSVDSEALYTLLRGPGRDRPTTVRVTLREIWVGLVLWLALHEPGYCSPSAEGELAERHILPCLFGFPSKRKLCNTVGLLGERGLCVLTRPPNRSTSVEGTDDSSPFELFVRSFGPDDTLAHRLIDEVAAWDRAGRPSSNRLRIRAYLGGGGYVPSANELVIPKRWTRLVIDWP